MLARSEFGPPIWLWMHPRATIEDLKARDETARKVLWCRKTWLEWAGEVFCKVGRLRACKARALAFHNRRAAKKKEAEQKALVMQEEG